jgi:hypothetical protein
LSFDQNAGLWVRSESGQELVSGDLQSEREILLEVAGEEVTGYEGDV